MSIQVRTDPRLAGEVLRYHVWPHIRQQSVGEHCWQLLRLTLKLWPEVPKHVMEYIVHHDTGEIAVGDIPFPVKRNNPALKQIMDELEQKALADMSLSLPKLSDIEHRTLKYIELLEMAEWGMGELRRGNEFARLVMDRCLRAMDDMAWGGSIPDSIVMASAEYVAWRKKEWNFVD